MIFFRIMILAFLYWHFKAWKRNN